MKKQSVLEILERIRYCTVSTVDEKGQPWAAPVWYAFDDMLNIYWWSPTTSQHSKNISNNNKVYITVFDSTLPEGSGIGVYMRGSAGPVEFKNLDAAMELYNASTKVFKMSTENCSGSASTRMYKATPSELWMNDESNANGFYEDVRTQIEL